MILRGPTRNTRTNDIPATRGASSPERTRAFATSPYPTSARTSSPRSRGSSVMASRWCRTAWTSPPRLGCRPRECTWPSASTSTAPIRSSCCPPAPLPCLPARLTRRKRIEAAIAATAALRGRGRDAALVVTGPPGPHNPENIRYLDELTALAKGVDGVHLLYPLGLKAPYRVIADLYALADVLVLPSQSEGFGLPLVEAAL